MNEIGNFCWSINKLCSGFGTPEPMSTHSHFDCVYSSWVHRLIGWPCQTRCLIHSPCLICCESRAVCSECLTCSECLIWMQKLQWVPQGSQCFLCGHAKVHQLSWWWSVDDSEDLYICQQCWQSPPPALQRLLLILALRTIWGIPKQQLELIMQVRCLGRLSQKLLDQLMLEVVPNDWTAWPRAWPVDYEDAGELSCIVTQFTSLPAYHRTSAWAVQCACIEANNILESILCS